jgi:hypothetical protein
MTRKDSILLRTAPRIHRVIKKLLSPIQLEINNGRIFWIDNNKKKLSQEILLQIEIVQKWKGNIPNLIKTLTHIRLRVKRVGKNLKKEIRTDIKNNEELKDWTKKYFREMDIDWLRLFIPRINTKIKELISINIQRKKKLFELLPIITLSTNKNNNNFLLLIKLLYV